MDDENPTGTRYLRLEADLHARVAALAARERRTVPMQAAMLIEEALRVRELAPESGR